MKKILSILAIFLLLATLSAKAQQNKELTRILFIFDASNSMNGEWKGGKKMDIARNMLIRLVDSLKYVKNIQMALRVYGHQTSVEIHGQDCNDTKLEVPFSRGNAGRIKAKLRKIVPKGTTPIARSLELCKNDFPRSRARNVVILITDGIEACDGDPCAVALALQSRNVVLKPFIIGIGLDVELIDAFQCVGQYYNAANPTNFKTALNQIITNLVSRTTVQVNLLDSQKKPTETNVSFTLYDAATGRVKNNFIHTMNKAGRPDTLILDPMSGYNMVVHTIPPVVVKNIKLTSGKHNIIKALTPQGTLVVKETNSSRYKDTPFIVRKKGSMATLHVQKFSERQKYLVGKYTLELLTLPRLHYSISIKQSKTTTIDVPQPGVVTFSMPSAGYGSLFVVRKGKLHRIYSLDNTTRQALSLQPGKYVALWRTKSAKKTTYSVSKTFRVSSGRSEYIKF